MRCTTRLVISNFITRCNILSLFLSPVYSFSSDVNSVLLYALEAIYDGFRRALIVSSLKTILSRNIVCTASSEVRHDTRDGQQYYNITVLYPIEGIL